MGKKQTTSRLDSNDTNTPLETRQKRQHGGGRHRIFTAEQRKVRNRLAQAAFRERRSQYTQILEETVVELEAIFRELQDSNRNTSLRADKAEQQCERLKNKSEALNHMLMLVAAENQRLRNQLTGTAPPRPLQSPLYDLNSQSSVQLLMSPPTTTREPLAFEENHHMGATMNTTDPAALLYNSNSLFFPSLDFGCQDPAMTIPDDLRSPSSL